MTDKELLQQALDELLHLSDGLDAVKIINEIRTRLAQPEPEPVAVVGLDMSEVNVYYGSQYCGKKQETKIAVFLKDVLIGTRLYTAPPQRKEWVGLTDEEHMKLATEWGCMSADWVLYAAAVEQKVKEKNA
jgi:hypothetical protein